MASYEPVIKNGASGAIFYVALKPRTANGHFQTNPTLASGDVKISIDGGAFANLATLPDVEPNAGSAVRVILSQAETNGDNLVIQFIDAAGDEWNDLQVNICTAAANFDTIKTETAAILDDTDDIGVAGAGLTAINLPDQTMNITGDITGNLSGSVGSVTGAVGSVTAGVTLANDAITAAKFDESTAFPLTAADTGSTTVARTGADGDTLETLSDQIDDLPTNAELATALGTADDAVLAAIDALPTNAELATALSTADDAVLVQVALVKAKTDSLTFTVAGQVDSNIQYVNDIQVTGDGEPGTEWGPV